MVCPPLDAQGEKVEKDGANTEENRRIGIINGA
jgi:hypothetical protein